MNTGIFTYPANRGLKITRFLGLYALLGVGLIRAEQTDASDWALPIETATFHGPWNGKGNFRHVVDKDRGRLALEYDVAPDGSSTEFWQDLEAVPAGRYDLLRFDWRSIGDPVLAQVTLESFPEPGGQRNYYLFKTPGTPGQWQRVWLDLGLDDDHPFFRKIEGIPEGKMRLRFRLRLNPVARPSPSPRITMRLSDAKLVRLPVTVTGDLRQVRVIDTAEHVGQLYTLQVRNRTDSPQRAALYVDSVGLREFRVELSESRFALAPGQTRAVEARVVMNKARAARLAPLYYEAADLFAGVEGQPETLAPWNWGYMRHRLHGAVPLPERPAPRLLSDEDAAAGRARLAGQAESVATPQQLKGAEGLLAYDPEPPDTIHGRPNCYFCPEHNAQLRCHGPGKHRCDKGKELVDVATMPQHVLRAAGYYEHTKLVDVSLRLARAGWDSGDRRFLKKAADILMAYARKYPKYPISDTSATSYYGRVGFGNLAESWWFAPLPRAYDLVRAAGVWSEEEAAFVERNLILEGVVLLRSHRSVANQQAEYNRGVGVGALAIGNAALAAEALYGEYGMRAQWALDFDGDGWTMERDAGYQRAAVSPFLDFARALSAAGVPVFDADFKKLFDAPVMRSPNLVAVPGDFYFEAWERYRDPIYLRSVARGRRQPLPELPEGFPNSVQVAGGFTMLRSGRNDADLVTASMNWGEPNYRGGRNLFSPTIRWRGHALNDQVLRIAYGSRFSPFSYTAAAGNTLVIDGEVQSMARAEQRALLDGPCPAGRWTAPATRPQYPGVEWSRSLAICGDSIVVLDQVTSARPVRMDRFTYLPVDTAAVRTANGAEPEWTPDEGFVGVSREYRYFTEPQRLKGSAPDRLSFPLNKHKTRIALLQFRAPDDTRFYRLRAPIHWHPRETQVWALQLNAATKAWFAEALSGVDTAAGATPDAVHLERVEVRFEDRPLPPEQALAVQVRNAAGTFLVLTSAIAGPHLVDGHTLTGPLAVLRMEEGGFH